MDAMGMFITKSVGSVTWVSFLQQPRHHSQTGVRFPWLGDGPTGWKHGCLGALEGAIFKIHDPAI